MVAMLAVSSALFVRNLHVILLEFPDEAAQGAMWRIFQFHFPAVRDVGLAAHGTPCLIRQPNCFELGRGRGLESFARLAEKLRGLKSCGGRR